MYPNQMKVIVDYIVKDLNAKNKRIAFVFPDNEAGKADLAPGLERLQHYNMESVAKEVVNPGSIEATSQVMNLKSQTTSLPMKACQTQERPIRIA